MVSIAATRGKKVSLFRGTAMCGTLSEIRNEAQLPGMCGLRSRKSNRGVHTAMRRTPDVTYPRYNYTPMVNIIEQSV